MADKVTIDSEGLVKVDGIPVCQRKTGRNGRVELFFRRKNNSRQRRVKGPGETITLDDFVEAVTDK